MSLNDQKIEDLRKDYTSALNRLNRYILKIARESKPTGDFSMKDFLEKNLESLTPPEWAKLTRKFVLANFQKTHVVRHVGDHMLQEVRPKQHNMRIPLHFGGNKAAVFPYVVRKESVKNAIGVSYFCVYHDKESPNKYVVFDYTLPNSCLRCYWVDYDSFCGFDTEAYQFSYDFISLKWDELSAEEEGCKKENRVLITEKIRTILEQYI